MVATCTCTRGALALSLVRGRHSSVTCEHLLECTLTLQIGITFGHENMGIVEKAGEGITLLKRGDRVVMPFNVADGRCRNCEEGKAARLVITNE